ncbi:MAG: MgtC/SapB family protein [Anaerolineae bacterium]
MADLTLQLWQKFALATLVGLLVGLEREHSRQERELALFAGVRTFPLVALLGCTTAMLAAQGQTWLFAVGFVGLSALVLAVYAVSAYRGDPGMTTEVAVLLVYLIGGLIFWDQIWLAVALGVLTTALLALRPTLHGLAARIDREDIYATLKFAVVSAVILPLLPDRAYGPLQVLNPFRMWLMVVFISAVSFSGYVAIKLLGPRHGIGLAGLLGGLVSSTAVTLSFSQRSREVPSLAGHFALGIVVASTTMYPRMALEILVFNPVLVGRVWPFMALLTGLGVGGGLYLWRAVRHGEEEATGFANPFRLGPAIQFGLLFGTVLLVTKAAQVALGDAGVYVASFLAGLTGVDPIVLSMAQLAGETVAYEVAARAVLLAAAANTLAKGGLALILGAPPLRRRALPVLGLLTLAGLSLAALTM